MLSVKTSPYHLFLLLVLGLFLLPFQAEGAKRVALVIGNSGYSNSPLKNPSNDAKDMAKTLTNIGFEVILENDASKRKIEDAMDVFYRKLQKAEVGFFFYAGHGMQIDGMNYLIPVGARVANANDVKYEAVPAGRILGKMEDAGNKLNIVVLDACRDNPFRSYFRSGNKGLAFMDAPDGTIIAYATSPGSVAADGRGKNGLYTGNLLANLSRSDLNVWQVFNQTGLDVRTKSGGRQTPWVTNSPLEPFYLAGGVSVAEDREQRIEAGEDVSTIKVHSNPSGATVYIDGKRAGETPVELGDMVPGSKTVRVELSGYATEEKQTTLRKGRRSVVRFDLSQKISKGWLTVSPEPANAEIRILNIAPSYSKDMSLDPGRYHIEVSANGYVTKTQWVDLEAGDTLDVGISLQRERVQQSTVAPVSVPQSSGSGRSFTDPVTGMEFVWVQGGCYQMGDTFGDGGSDEQPVHEVCVDGFYMGKYEVTQGEYQKITGSNPSRFQKGSNYPVEAVSWDDAHSFIGKLNGRSGETFRLPTEAEWEYAARSGGKKEKYAGGNSIDSLAWWGSNSNRSSHQVGTKSPNGLGLYDMSGNVMEWCSDWYDSAYYKSSPRSNPQGPLSGSYRVLRGGSWSNFPRNVRSAYRNRIAPGIRFNYLGFRLVFSSGQ